MRHVQLLIAGLLFSYFASSTAVRSAEPARRLILVVGESAVEAPPDQIALRLGITTENEELLEARAANDRRAAAIIKIAGEGGVSPQQMQTESFDIAAEYDKEQGRMQYRVVRTIDITVRDVARFEPLLANLLKQGGFKIASISLACSQLDRYRTEARRRAYADARQKASQLADLDGQKLGKAWSIVIEEAQEKQTPFVTSVIPVVGGTPRSGSGGRSAGTPFGGRAPQGQTERSVGQRAPGAATSPVSDSTGDATSAQLVVFQAAAKAPTGKPPVATVLSPGRISVESSVTIQFEVESQAAR